MMRTTLVLLVVEKGVLTGGGVLHMGHMNLAGMFIILRLSKNKGIPRDTRREPRRVKRPQWTDALARVRVTSSLACTNPVIGT